MEAVICGIDEAGRGPLAGPVVAAAVWFRSEVPSGVGDSKQLTARRREALEPLIKSAGVWAIGTASAAEIDDINILRATMLAMQRAVAGLKLPRGAVLRVDGNRAPKFAGVGAHRVTAVIDGDALVAEIGAASILAKVHRDRLMADLDVRHPGYGFRGHAGYDVPSHREALARLGPCPEHRRSFKPVRLAAEAFEKSVGGQFDGTCRQVVAAGGPTLVELVDRFEDVPEAVGTVGRRD